MLVYLDWNIITNLINPDKIPDRIIRDQFIYLKQLFEYPNEEVIFPYSDAHLKDLKRSFDKGERDRVSQSLDYISVLTRNICLVQYWNEENAIWQTRDPFDFFNSIVMDNSSNFNSWDDLLEPLKEYGLDKIFDIYKNIPHNINFEEVEQYNPFFASLFPRARIENNLDAVIRDTFEMFSKVYTNPAVYKELRKIFKEGLKIDSNISNFQNVIDELDKYLPKTLLNKSFTELYDLNTKSSIKNKTYDKIIGVFMQLDFVGYNSDKLSEKNRYDNIFNDALHCFYAAHCDLFLTNDIKNSKKSKAVFESEKIATQVYNTKEFIEMLKRNIA